MKLTFYGATETVTGSKYLIEHNQRKILLDCGLFQGFKELRERNWDAPPFDPKSIDAVVLTHAHIDHSGYIPLLIKNGFKGKIYCTPATRDLCEILLQDSGHLQEEDARRANKYGYSKHSTALPLYTAQDAINSMPQFHPVSYNHNFDLGEGLHCSFMQAGHILGAAFVKFNFDDKSLFFSGDMGRPNDPIMRPPVGIDPVDYMVLESTYGNRLHGSNDQADEIAEIINRTTERGGSILIPAFAVARAQSLLYYIYHLIHSKRISDIPVYLDSPMAINATKLLCKYHDDHKLSLKECEAICENVHYAKTQEESKQINSNDMPKIVISASGMATGGRVLHHIKSMGVDHRNTIMFTGFQAGGTRGDRMTKGETKIKIHGEIVDIKAEVVQLHNASAHADYKEMMEWLKRIHKAPRTVFLTHGEISASESLRDKIEQELGWKVVIPTYKQSFEL